MFQPRTPLLQSKPPPTFQAVNNELKINNDLEVAHPQSGSSSTWFLVELQFGNVAFWGEGKTGVPGEKPLGEREGTNNKLDPPMASIPGFLEPGPHWWEASSLTTAPSLAPQIMRGYVIYSPKRTKETEQSKKISKRRDWFSSRPILTLLRTCQAVMKITRTVGVPALKDHLALQIHGSKLTLILRRVGWHSHKQTM